MLSRPIALMLSRATGRGSPSAASTHHAVERPGSQAASRCLSTSMSCAWWVMLSRRCDPARSRGLRAIELVDVHVTLRWPRGNGRPSSAFRRDRLPPPAGEQRGEGAEGLKLAHQSPCACRFWALVSAKRRSSSGEETEPC